MYGPNGQKVGYIERVMIDKVSGRVPTVSFGGLFGIGDDHYPLPWKTLKYDTNLGGYVTGVTQERIRGAPKYADAQNMLTRAVGVGTRKRGARSTITMGCLSPSEAVGNRTSRTGTKPPRHRWSRSICEVP